MDVFATYWQRLTRIVGWNDARISVEEGGMEKLVIVAISLNLLTERLDHVKCDIFVIVYIWTMLWMMLIFNLIL